MRSVAPITKIVPLFLWSAKMPKIYAKCQKFMQKLWNFIFCHLNIVRAVYKLSFKLLVRSVAQITKIVPPFLWFRGGLCYKQRRIRHGANHIFEMNFPKVTEGWSIYWVEAEVSGIVIVISEAGQKQRQEMWKRIFWGQIWWKHCTRVPLTLSIPISYIMHSVLNG